MNTETNKRIVLEAFDTLFNKRDYAAAERFWTPAYIQHSAYIAPERARGERAGPASDLWSLGATLYTAVEGRPPYDRGGAVETLTAVVTQDPDPPHRAGPLWPAISGLLRGDRELRLDAAAAEQMLLTVAGTPEALPPAAALTSPAGPAAGPGATVGHRTDPTVTLTREEPARPLHPASGQDAPAARPEGSGPATQPLPPPPHPARRRRRSWTIINDRPIEARETI